MSDISEEMFNEVELDNDIIDALEEDVDFNKIGTLQKAVKEKVIYHFFPNIHGNDYANIIKF